MAGDFVYHSYSIDTAASTVTKKDEYIVRTASSYRVYAKVAFIADTDYFLTSSLSKNGVNRFKIGTVDSYSQLKFDGVPLSLDTTDLLVIPRAKFALLSYSNYNNIILFDFIEMKF